MRNGPYTLIVAPDGYPGKRYRGRYCYEHHYVFWKTHGRLPKRGECVHHKNERGRDNRPRNLEAMTKGAHTRHHHPAGPQRPLVHGTRYSYQRHKCRCKKCRRAVADIIAAYRKKYGRKS